jgi:hypothetical protein
MNILMEVNYMIQKQIKKSMFAILLCGLLVSGFARTMHYKAATVLDWATVISFSFLIKWAYDKMYEAHENALDARFLKHTQQSMQKQKEEILSDTENFGIKTKK